MVRERAGVVGRRVDRFLVVAATVRGESKQLFTLQSTVFPWEAWIVLPLCWLLLVAVVRQTRLEQSARAETL